MLRPLLRRARVIAAPVVKRALSRGAAFTGIYRLVGSAYGGRGVIFTLHRVLEPGATTLWPGYAIAAPVLDEILSSTRRLGWQAVAIDELPRRLSGSRADGRFVCFTLDDGYADNLSVALPVFQRRQVPFSVYVNTGLVERSAFYWWGGLEDLVLGNDRIEWDGGGPSGPLLLRAGTLDEKRRAYSQLNRILDRSAPDVARRLLERYGVDWAAAMDRDLLSLEQTRALSRNPLVTLGSHCVAHERLAGKSEADAARELADSKRILEGWIDKEVRHLAYPFGDPTACGPREFELARKAGYVTAVTTRRGNVFPEHLGRLTELPRREVPLDEVSLRNALSGAASLLKGHPARPAEETGAARAAHGHAAATRRVVRNSIWLIGQPLLMNAISLLATAYIARMLGRTDYGRFVFALSFITMFMPLTNLGLRFLSIRHIAGAGGQDVSAYVGKVSVLRFALALAGAALSIGAVTVAQGAPETRHVVYLATCIIALQAVTTTATDVFQAYETMRLVARVNFVSGITLTLLSVVALYLGYGLLGLMGAYVVGNLLGAALALRLLYTRFLVPRLSIDLGFWKTSLAAAAPLFFPNLVRDAGSRLGIVLLGGLTDQAAVGSYGAGSMLMEKMAVIPDGVCSALFPAMAKAHQRSPAEAAALYERFFHYFLVLALPIAVGTTVLARPIISLIFGRGYEDSPLVLAVLAWGLFGTFFVQLQGWSIGAIHQERKAFFVPVAATLTYLPLALLLIPRFQELGLAVAALAMAAVHLVRYRSIVRAHLTTRTVRTSTALRILLANAVMAAATLAVRDWPVFLSIPLGAAVYAAAAVAVRAVAPSEAIQVLRSIFGRARSDRAAT